MAAYDYADSAMAGGIEGVGDAKTIDSVVLQEVVGFGKPLFGYMGGNANSPAKAFGFKKDVAKVVFGSDFSASNSTVVTVNGVASAASVYGTSHAASIADLIAKIKAIPVSTANPLGVEAVLDATDSNSRTILIRTKGVNVTADSTTTGGSAVTDTWTYGSGQIFLGIHLFRHGDPSVSPAIKEIVSAVRIGTIWATSNAGPLMDQPAYVADAGTMDDTGTAIASVRFASNYISVSSVGLAKVEVLGKTTMQYGAVAF